jgi:hypothetical protein
VVYFLEESALVALSSDGTDIIKATMISAATAPASILCLRGSESWLLAPDYGCSDPAASRQ